MTKLEHFEVVNGVGIFRPVRETSLEQGVGLITAAIAHARALELRRLLVVASGVTGHPPASVSERYFFVREWAATAGPQMRIAMVARPEQIDPQKFGVTVAANAGLTGDVFTSESEALAWLHAER